MIGVIVYARVGWTIRLSACTGWCPGADDTCFFDSNQQCRCARARAGVGAEEKKELNYINPTIPKTYELIKDMNNIKTAFFSILPPGKHIKAHFGPFKGVLRYHLALQIPQNKDECYILVNEKKNVGKKG